MAECLTTTPLAELTLQEARFAWGNDVIVFGGVPSVFLEEAAMTDDEFEEYARELLRTIAPGNAFIMGVADNVMPPAKIERLARITEMVEECGRIPIGG